MHNIRSGMWLAAMACLGTVACDASVEPEATALELPAAEAMLGTEEQQPLLDESEARLRAALRHAEAWLEPGSEPLAEELSTLAGGGIELKTNLLRGTVRFTNQNTQILTLLANDPWRYGGASANSTAPGGYNASTSSPTFTTPSEFTFEMLVEAGARGDSGVVYNVSAYRGGTSFPTIQNVTVKPKEVQPLPTDVTLQQCIGVIRFKFGQDAACTTPATNVPSAYLDQFSSYRSQNELLAYVPGGWQGNTTVHYTISTTGGAVLRSQTVPLNVACDAIVPVCVQVPVVAPPPVGAITGPWEIAGETSVLARYIQLFEGPNGAGKSQSISVAPAPVGDPTKWWTITNLQAGTYSMYAQGYLRSGRDFTYYTTPYLASWTSAQQLNVPAGQTTPVTKVVNGQTRYPLVMQPSYFYGSVKLADPYVATHPGAFSSLQSLYFTGDWDSNGDGIPNNSYVLSGTGLSAYVNGGQSHTAFPNSFNPLTGELASAYEQVLLSPFDLPLTWSQDSLQLRFWSEGQSFSTRPGLYDPVRFRNGTLYLYRNNRSKLMAPGERFRIDQEYCFNEMQLDYSTGLGRFYNPYAQVSGSFNGTDWQGRQLSYSVNGTFYGTPAVWGYSALPSYAQPSGSISLALPQGTYTLRPGATMVSDTGQTNNANFQPIQVTLGCGQRLKVVPPLTVSLAALAGCATSGSTAMSGVVKSAPAQVDRIWYRLNGGPEVTLCTNCGTDPTFAFNVPLQTCANMIQVYAFTDGMPEPATGFQEITWDDPSDGPSCPGTYCVNRPPVARCRSVTMPLDATCGGGNAAVNDGSYDPDTGDTLSCTQTPNGPYSAGSRRVTLTCTDGSGLSSSCEATVAVVDTTAPVLTCPTSSGLECGTDGDVSQGVSATDNCSASPAVTCTAGTSGPTGTPVTCTATDAAGNRATCQFVRAAVDTQAPVLTCPAAVSAECTGSSAATVTLPAATATDNCGGTPTVSGGGTASYPVGTTPAPYTATDAAGNSATCSTPVTVTDTQAPTLELVGPSELVVQCGSSVIQGVVATDVCAGDISSRVQPVGFHNLPGTYHVSYRVTDLAGNAAQGLYRKVTVLPAGTTSMTLLGDSQLRLECGVDTWTDPGATAADACGGPLAVHKYNSGDDDGDGVPGEQDPDDHGPGPDTSVEGTYPVQYIAWDASGYMVSATRSVQVDDRHAPTLKLHGAAWMTHVCGTAWEDPGVVAMDACYGDVGRAVVRTGYVNGWVPGLYTVRYEVTDGGGNAAPAVERTVQVTACPW
jgi:hypothetical protein